MDAGMPGQWWSRLGTIEALEDAPLDRALVDELEARALQRPPGAIRFSTPTFKDYAGEEIQGCSKNSFPEIGRAHV